MISPNEPGPEVRRLSADDLYEEEVEEARSRTVEEKLLAGIELFDRACEFMRAGIRMQYPDADAERVEELLDERLALGRRLENGE
jgi:hypothetical protein